MATALNGPMAASGFVGAITSLAVGYADKWMPVGDAKALLSIIVGMLAAVMAFEILAWYAVFRLRRTRAVLDRMIPQFERLLHDLQSVIDRQLVAMEGNDATKTSRDAIRREVNELSVAIIRAMIALQSKSLDLVKNISAS